MTIVVISQPMYFPWAGFLDLISRADVLIWLDDVQFSKGSFTNRVQAKLPAGTSWMTVPLLAKGNDWVAAHRETLSQSVAEAPYWELALDVFDAVTGDLAIGEQELASGLIDSAEKVLEVVGKPLPERLRSSGMKVPGRSWRRVLDLVLAAGGTRYFSAAGGANYIHHETFDAAGVAVNYIAYAFDPWPQRHGAFTPYVSGLDLLAGAAHEGHNHLLGKMVPWRDYLVQKGRTLE